MFLFLCVRQAFHPFDCDSWTEEGEEDLPGPKWANSGLVKREWDCNAVCRLYIIQCSINRVTVIQQWHGVAWSDWVRWLWVPPIIERRRVVEQRSLILSPQGFGRCADGSSMSFFKVGEAGFKNLCYVVRKDCVFFYAIVPEKHREHFSNKRVAELRPIRLEAYAAARPRDVQALQREVMQGGPVEVAFFVAWQWSRWQMSVAKNNRRFKHGEHKNIRRRA